MEIGESAELQPAEDSVDYEEFLSNKKPKIKPSNVDKTEEIKQDAFNFNGFTL